MRGIENGELGTESTGATLPGARPSGRFNARRQNGWRSSDALGNRTLKQAEARAPLRRPCHGAGVGVDCGRRLHRPKRGAA